MKNENWVDILIKIVIIASAIFFGLYKIIDIPPGTQDDVLRAVITSEQYLKGLDGGNTSLRQSIAYFILGGHWTSYFVDLARGYNSVEMMIIISRLPAVFFFNFGTYLWYEILKLLNFKRTSIGIFFFIFLPSSYFITYSHHIPLVAGYFFFGTSGIYYLLKFFKDEITKYRYLLLSLISFGLITYTHGISIFFTLSYIVFFLSFVLFFKSDDIKKVVLSLFKKENKRNSTKYIFILILFLLTLYPFIDGFISSDNSIKTRDANTIKYLIDNNEVELLKEKTVQKVLSYTHPNTLVFSKDIINGTQPKDSKIFFDIKNPTFNQWVTTNLSPFGMISAIAYIGILFCIIQLLRTKDYKYLITTVLFLTYFAVIVPTNYDNPSIAKVILPILWIPLSIVLLLENVIEKNNELPIKLTIFLFIIINAIYNLSYLYSPMYSKNESNKYYAYNYKNVFKEIMKTTDYTKLRIFVPYNDSGTTNIISFYLGIEGINRTVFGKFDDSLINREDYNYFITENPKDFEGIKGVVISEYKEESAINTLFLGKLVPKGSLSDKLVKNNDLRCSTYPYYPIRVGEFELTHYNYKYFDSNGLNTNNCPDTIGNPYNFYIQNNKLLFLSSNEKIIKEEPLKENNIAAIKKYSLISDTPDSSFITDLTSFKIVSGSEESTTLLKLSTINPEVVALSGTYILAFNYDLDKYSYLDFFGIDTSTGLSIPLNLLKQNYHPGYNGEYKTLVYLPSGKEFVLDFTLYNRHLNIDKSKHSVKADINNLKIIYLSPDNLTLINKTAQTSSPKYYSVQTAQIFPGVYQIEKPSNLNDMTVVLNRTFTKFYSKQTEIVNGISPSVKLANEKYIISESLINGTTYFFEYLIIISGFTLFFSRNVAKKRN